MKKLLSAAVFLLLLLCLSPRASADVTYPDPAPLEVGQTLNHLAASVEPGSSVTVSAGLLPPGVELVLDQQPGADYVYLRGVLTEPGYYDFVLSINDQSSFLCSIEVDPARPKLVAGPNVNCYLNDTVHVSVNATVSDGGQLSYQWYASSGGTDSSLIAGAVEPIYQPGTDYVGTTYYYCVVTNDNNGMGVSAASPYISVTVDALSLTDVSIASLPEKTDYTVGDQLNTNGLSLLVSFSDGSSRSISSGYQVYPTLLDQAGTQIIEVSYGDHVCSFQVNVREAQEIVDRIVLLSLPRRTSYVVGETLDPDGLSVRAYTNLGVRDVSEGLLCAPMQLTQEGTQEIIVSYQGKSCSFSVTVESEEQPEYLTIHRLPDKLSYTAGDPVDTRGLVLYLVSNHNNYTEITAGYSVSPQRLDAVGQQDITVSYANYSCRYSVNVIAAGESPVNASPSPSPAVVSTPFPAASPAQASPAPPTLPLMPTPAPQPSRTVGSSRSFLTVVVVASVLALGVIAAYVFIMNRGGFDMLEQKLEDLFRRRRK